MGCCDVLWETVCKYVGPTVTYHHSSGMTQQPGAYSSLPAHRAVKQLETQGSIAVAPDRTLDPGVTSSVSGADEVNGDGVVPPCVATCVRRKLHKTAPKKGNGNNLRMSHFLWDTDTATRHAQAQIGVSACGATALLNVFAGLGLPTPSHDAAIAAVRTRTRAGPAASCEEYLVCRSVAGCRGEDIVDGCMAIAATLSSSGAPHGGVASKFFPLSQGCDVRAWLVAWMAAGGVCVATLNPQLVSRSADAWHHQMLYGVDDDGVHATNPVEVIPFDAFRAMASSAPVLRVRQADVAGRPRGTPCTACHAAECKDTARCDCAGVGRRSGDAVLTGVPAAASSIAVAASPALAAPPAASPPLAWTTAGASSLPPSSAAAETGAGTGAVDGLAAAVEHWRQT